VKISYFHIIIPGKITLYAYEVSPKLQFSLQSGKKLQLTPTKLQKFSIQPFRQLYASQLTETQTCAQHIRFWNKNGLKYPYLYLKRRVLRKTLELIDFFLFFFTHKKATLLCAHLNSSSSSFFFVSSSSFFSSCSLLCLFASILHYVRVRAWEGEIDIADTLLNLPGTYYKCHC
jgi:hypothetical protein